VKDTIAIPGAEVTGAGVIALEAHLPRHERAQDGVGDVVTALLTFAIQTRQNEQRRRRIHDDPSNVGGFRHDATHSMLFDLQTQGFELGNFGFEARRLVFAAASLAGALRCLSEASMIHDVHLTPLGFAMTQTRFLVTALGRESPPALRRQVMRLVAIPQEQERESVVSSGRKRFE
jgi:hypothetical protein